MEIHVARNGQQMGPFSIDEVNRQIAAGTLSPTDQGWYEGAAGWAPLSTVPGIIAAGSTGTAPSASMPAATPPPAAAPIPASAGATAPAPTSVAPVAVVETFGGKPLANFGPRLGAYLIDGLIVGIPVTLITLVGTFALGSRSGAGVGTAFGLNFVFALLGFAIAFGYEAYFLSSEKQATFGKQILGLKVTDLNGGKLVFQTIAIRTLIKCVSFAGRLLPCIGSVLYLVPIASLVTVLTNVRRQAIHDMAAGTVVVQA